MKKMLISVSATGRLRAASVKEGVLYKMEVENVQQRKRRKGNIYVGIIKSIEPSLAAAFIDYGAERDGFLPFKSVNPLSFSDKSDENSQNTPFDPQAALKPNQKILVQVEKDERGTKGAVLTTFMVLSGSFLIIMPNNPRADGVSRSIEYEERQKLRAIFSKLSTPENMGLIIRTAGAGNSLESFQWELQSLLSQWQAIEVAAKKVTSPTLIYQESDLLRRVLRDSLRTDVSSVVIDKEEVFAEAKQYIQQMRPEFLSKLHLHKENKPIFTKYKIQHQLEAASRRRVALPSGGNIVIDYTEALIAIDVNSSRAKKGNDLEETAFLTNMEAIKAIVDHMILRNFTGIIVIDLIDMKKSSNKQRVRDYLAECIREDSDSAKITLGYISQFGLLVMSRQCLYTSPSEFEQEVCPRCSGCGKIPGMEGLAQSLLYMLEEEATESDVVGLDIYLPIDLAAYLANEKRPVIQEIEKRWGLYVAVIPNAQLVSPHYKINVVRSEKAREKSYKLVENLVEDSFEEVNRLDAANQDVPIVKPTFPTKEVTQKTRPKRSVGSIVGFWKTLFKRFKPSSHNKQQPINRRKGSTPRYPSRRMDSPGNERDNYRNANNRRGRRTGYKDRDRAR